MRDNYEDISRNKKFGFTVAIVLLLIAGYDLLLKHKEDKIIEIVGLSLLVLTLLKPLLLTPIRIFWDKIGLVLGIINTYVLLSLFYCLVLTPLGLIMRLLHKDVLKLKKSIGRTTYWEIDSKIEESKMENQF